MAAEGSLRIIGGRWRNRKLPVVDLPGLRPTTDRVRETLFNWLQADIPGAYCLDCFAGSGALGFEAASRGAEQVIMLELQTEAYKKLCDNKRILAADNIQCLQQDATQWLKAVEMVEQQQVDVVFLDPPYASNLLEQICALLEQSAILAVNAKIYIEHSTKQALPELPENWQIIRGKKAGQVSYHLIQRI
jgi:16S rRNA (guanine966-N2)-methyltransferase